MPVDRDAVIITLMILIVVILLLKRRVEGYNNATPSADIIFRPLNIGLDLQSSIISNPAKLTTSTTVDLNVYKKNSGYATPTLAQLTWWQLNEVAWATSGCVGFRKVLQLGGGGAAQLALLRQLDEALASAMKGRA